MNLKIRYEVPLAGKRAKLSCIQLFLQGFIQAKASFTNWKLLLNSEPELVPFWNYVFFGYLIVSK